MPARRPAQSSARAATVLAALLLAACGGGGSSSTDTPAAGSGTATPSAPARLGGVVAYGAPLVGATLTVIDAKGAVVGNGSTNATDGSYALTLNTATPTAPLLVQAAGHDATGLPMLLHAALAAVSASTIVNVTPLTNAAVALALGAEPGRIFAMAAAKPTVLSGLAQATAAADFAKTLVKNNLSDAKITNLTTLDLVSGSGFAADKTGVDLALETVNIGYGSNARGGETLVLANKLGTATAEVVVDLATAQAELAKTTGATPATAITSTLKAATSPTAMASKLAAIDTLAVAVNNAIAAGGRSTLATALTTGYQKHNGRTAADVAELVAGWADRNMQWGRVQVTGCADVAIASTGCAKVAIAVRLVDASGAQTGSYSDAVSLGTGANASTWSLVGNNLPADAAVQPVAWLALDGYGAAPATAGTNPRVGVQVAVQSAVDGAKAQMPGGHVLTLVPCGRPVLCVTATAGATSAVAAGTLTDHAVFQATSAWLGAADVAAGARYAVMLTPASGTAVTRPAVLRSSWPAAPATDRFPVLDGVNAARGLASATLLAGRVLSWKAWADANPDMRLTSVRIVLAGATAADAAFVTETSPTRWTATSLESPAVTVPDAYVGSTVAVWLSAVDAAGRLHVTSYADLPVN